MIKLIRNMLRALEIFMVCIFFAVLPIAKGRKLALCFETLGPVFIKFGQSLSTRSDVIGEEMAEQLSFLRDKLPHFAFSKVKKIIRQQLKNDVASIFADFDPTPVAAASIAQVHKAKTHNNKDVAVKILRPNIEKAFARDISLMYLVAKIFEKISKRARRLRLCEVVATFEHNVAIELDLRFEGASASEIRENTLKDGTVYIPPVFWEYTSSRVLTSEWVTGIPLNDIKALREAGLNMDKIVRNLAVTFFNQAYRDGLFHADVHQGNLFVAPDNKIIAVDFGIVGRLDHKTRVYVAEILKSFLARDYKRIAEIHFQAGYVPRHHSKELFATAMRSIGEPIVGQPASKVSVSRLLAHLFKITEAFDMPTQPQLLLLQKTTMLVEGVGASLDPNVNMWKLAEPWIKDWAKSNLGFDAKIRDSVLSSYYFLTNDLHRLLERISAAPKKHKAEINYYKLTGSIVFAVVISFTLIRFIIS